MDIASDICSSGMMTIFYGRDAKLGLATSAARKWVEERHGIERPVCQVANYLCEGAKALGGHVEVRLRHFEAFDTSGCPVLLPFARVNNELGCGDPET